MYNNENTLLMDALEAVGVDNWQGYDDALELMEGDEDNRMELLDALHDAGVENWSGYDAAIDLRDDMLQEIEAE